MIKLFNNSKIKNDKLESNSNVYRLFTRASYFECSKLLSEKGKPMIYIE